MRSWPVHQPMTLTFSAWDPFWPCVMSNSTFCPPQGCGSRPGDRAEVHEHVRAALDRDETVALVTVEPLHSALRILTFFVRDAGSRHGGGARACRDCSGQPVTQHAAGG